MSERITRGHLEGMAAAIASAADRVGATREGHSLALQSGSPTYGRAWRLYWRDADTGGLWSAFGLTDGYLGATSREAYRTLKGLKAGLEALESVAR